MSMSSPFKVPKMPMSNEPANDFLAKLGEYEKKLGGGFKDERSDSKDGESFLASCFWDWRIMWSLIEVCIGVIG